MPSIKDVAELAGVSYTTVSHVINNTRRVKDETREKVKKAIVECGYRPNQTARNLKKGKTFTIAVIDANSSDIYFLEVMRAAQIILEKAGYTLLFSFSDSPDDECNDKQEWFAQKELDYLEQFICRDVDAIILNPINSDETLEDFFKDVTIPTLLFQRQLPGPNNFAILSDDYRGGYDAVKHLIDLGHTRLAVVYGFSYVSHSVFKRKTGIIDAASENSIIIPDVNWVDGKYDSETSYEETTKLLNSDNPPTAIFYYSDVMAIAGLRAAADLGLSIPKDLSIIGYDDINICKYTIPRLTTIRQDSHDMGFYIGQKTLDLINRDHGKNIENRLQPVTLILRESTGSYSTCGTG